MNGDEGFRELLREVQGGSSEATRTLVDRFTPLVLKVIRRRLSRRVRPEFDSADFAQSVWAAFFQDNGAIASFETPRQLTGYLQRVAENRVIDGCRRRLGRSAQGIREVPLRSSLIVVSDPQPRPSEVFRAKDTLARVLDNTPPEVRNIVQMRALGASHIEIAELLGVDPKTVQRFFRRLDRNSPS